MRISSRRTPIQTLPARSARAAWNSATSGRIAGTTRIGSIRLPKGLSMTRQSGRWRTRSEPSTPRSGRNGTPFSAACRPAWMRGAGRVADLDRARLDRRDEARRRTLLAERHRGGFDAAHAAGADQQVGLEAELGHADQMQLPARRADQRAHRRERAARIVGRQRHARAVGQRAASSSTHQHRSHGRNLCRHSPNCHTRRQFNRWPVWTSASRLVGPDKSE